MADENAEQPINETKVEPEAIVIKQEERKSFFANIDLSGKRLPEEVLTGDPIHDAQAQTMYKARQTMNKKLVKAYKQGRTVWEPGKEIYLPKTDEKGEILKDDKGKTILSDRKVTLGTYLAKIYGRLKDIK